MSEITAFDINQLSKRWGVAPNSIRNMEREGKLHRLKDLPGVRFSAAEVYQLENIGREARAMTPWERRALLEKIERLEAQVAEMRERLTKAQAVLQGFDL